MSPQDQQTNAPPGGLYYGELDENGVDLSLIRENLKRTPLERIRRAEAAAEETLVLLEYGRRHRENALREARSPAG